MTLYAFFCSCTIRTVGQVGKAFGPRVGRRLGQWLQTSRSHSIKRDSCGQCTGKGRERNYHSTKKHGQCIWCDILWNIVIYFFPVYHTTRICCNNLFCHHYVFVLTSSRKILWIKIKLARALALHLGPSAAMVQQKDAFTYLQAGSKPKALEIAQSADLRQMNEHGQSLMFAAAGRPLNKGSSELLCQILQKRGLAVDALDNHHQTPLFAAAREGNEICADWLIAQGCAVDHADFRGETPLCIAFRNSQMEMVMKLLKHGASLGVKDMYGGRQPPFFANPIFRRAFMEKRAETPETMSSPKKRKRGQAEDQPLWKRFRGDLSLRCTGPNVMTQWAFQDEVVPDEKIPEEKWQRGPGREWWLHRHRLATRSNSKDPCSGAGICFGSCGLSPRAPHAPGYGTWRMGRLFWSPCERGWCPQIDLQFIEKGFRYAVAHLLCREEQWMHSRLPPSWLFQWSDLGPRLLEGRVPKTLKTKHTKPRTHMGPHFGSWRSWSALFTMFILFWVHNWLLIFLLIPHIPRRPRVQMLAPCWNKLPK